MLMRALTVVSMWAVAAVLLAWAYLPARLRRALALLASGMGLAFLVMALNAAGQRETSTWADFLVGPGYVTSKASASASLPYYVMTGLCVLLGTVGLALPEWVAVALRRRWLVAAVGLSAAVTVVRLLLERAAAPPLWAWSFGVTALAPLIGAWFWLSARAEGRGWGDVVKALAVYGVAVRAWITLLYAAATTFRLGSTHYNIAAVTRARNPITGTVHVFQPGSIEQLVDLVVVPQLLFWPLYTVVAGLMGAGLARLAAWPLLSRRGRERMEPVGVEMAALRQD